MLNWQYLVLINLAPNLTTQIKLLHSFDTEGLVFKTAWGFPIFSMVRLQFFHQGCLSKLHFFFLLFVANYRFLYSPSNGFI